jgi:hypothetical protein
MLNINYNSFWCFGRENYFVEQNAGGARTGAPQEQQVCHPQVALRLHREVEDQIGTNICVLSMS